MVPIHNRCHINYRKIVPKQFENYKHVAENVYILFTDRVIYVGFTFEEIIKNIILLYLNLRELT